MISYTLVIMFYSRFDLFYLTFISRFKNKFVNLSYKRRGLSCPYHKEKDTGICFLRMCKNVDVYLHMRLCTL